MMYVKVPRVSTTIATIRAAVTIASPAQATQKVRRRSISSGGTASADVIAMTSQCKPQRGPLVGRRAPGLTTRRGPVPAVVTESRYHLGESVAPEPGGDIRWPLG